MTPLAIDKVLTTPDCLVPSLHRRDVGNVDHLAQSCVRTAAH